MTVTRRCKSGLHLMTPENTYTDPKRPRSTRCRKCKAVYDRKCTITHYKPRPPVPGNCAHCGAPFVGRRQRRYCRKQCAIAAWKLRNP